MHATVYCAERDTLQVSPSSSRSVSAHDRLARVARSQFLTVLSLLPLVSCLPSELKHTDLTTAECPLRVDKHDPEVMSHVLMVLSSEPLATMLGLSGLKATHIT